jgi:hypothetical protein
MTEFIDRIRGIGTHALRPRMVSRSLGATVGAAGLAVLPFTAYGYASNPAASALHTRRAAPHCALDGGRPSINRF